MLIVTILANLSGVFTEPVPDGTPGEIETGRVGKEKFEWFISFAYIPALYLVGRISLVFPSIAIDHNKSMRWSWQVTKGNGLRMFIIVGALPWLLSILLGLLWRENATLVEQAILGVVMYILMAIEIFALSLTYKEFQLAAISLDI
jgi:membrane-anchored glycerophosphoryl diester phosphodiesterase (GDPDase)